MNSENVQEIRRTHTVSALVIEQPSARLHPETEKFSATFPTLRSAWIRIGRCNGSILHTSRCDCFSDDEAQVVKNTATRNVDHMSRLETSQICPHTTGVHPSFLWNTGREIVMPRFSPLHNLFSMILYPMSLLECSMKD